ncbi:hypothetical protein EDB81DRAFT_660323 [Dactylonectria macrodidyma]|uniref:Short-chain dehydrogenase n=1 Tax=Dactylonectria macrodidyma TaxID=307937 RepID=A0A9P9IU24_9HYPO|nr:hypothetical protein EDB81DRAFT_660323 [Dactylonectria macrodidyma]
MSSSSPVALILGAGPAVGQTVGRAFAAKGYKVALSARSLKEEDSTPDLLHIRSDFTDPSSIIDIFDQVKSKLGTPAVVVYNAYSATVNDGKDPLGLLLEDFTRDFNVNATSAFVAAQQAVLGFGGLPESASRTFIYTGNCCNVLPYLPMLSLGIGKSAIANLILAVSEAYKDKGYKFYYADERGPDGTPPYDGISPEAHGEYYTALAETTSQGPWQQTFAKGIGYIKSKELVQHQ